MSRPPFSGSSAELQVSELEVDDRQRRDCPSVEWTKPIKQVQALQKPIFDFSKTNQSGLLSYDLIHGQVRSPGKAVT